MIEEIHGLNDQAEDIQLDKKVLARECQIAPHWSHRIAA